jgi:hypothetical protein
MHTYVKITRADDSARRQARGRGASFRGWPVDGLKLIGFAVWARRDGGGQNVTFPARQFTVRGERRSYTLLRAIENTEAEKRLRNFVLQAYMAYDDEPAAITPKEVEALPGRRRTGDAQGRHSRCCYIRAEMGYADI